MNKVSLFIRNLSIAISVFILIYPGLALAEKEFPCLRGSTGRKIIWSASWQNDRNDDNIAYQISKVLHFETNSSYSVVLKLIAETKASKEIRHLPIASAVFARMVCKNLTGRPTKLRKIVSTNKKVLNKLHKQLQFIKYLRQGWVRADLPRTQIPLETCIIMGREFLCLEEEKLRFGEQLQVVAEQIEAQPRLRR